VIAIPVAIAEATMPDERHRERKETRWMRWSPQQLAALRKIDRWLNAADPAPWFYLAGYAGSGKTTLAKEIARRAGGKVGFGAFTGKAAAVMRGKGCEGAGTIDRLIYRPQLKVSCTNDPPCRAPPCDDRCQYYRERHVGRALNPDSAVANTALIIIDECSMVDESMARDLLSFGVPVLVLGDPAQLPPIYGHGYFTNREPDVMLSEVHRQAFGNPIIELATRVRSGKPCCLGQYGDSAVVTNISIAAMLEDHDQVIVGTHALRHALNAECRRHLGFTSALPNVGERLLCLKNNRYLGLHNGTLWTVVATGDAHRGFVDLIVQDEDGQEVEVSAPIDGFALREGGGTDLPGHPFTYGYAITCHKSQGSAWHAVCVVDESRAFRSNRWRWLYTAITRAAERVTIVDRDAQPATALERKRMIVMRG
jgi:ATP-dependent exoDNAse (exonuclease V) alpha subunit